MKVYIDGRELFEIEINEPIPEEIEVSGDTPQWHNKWAIFALVNFMLGNGKVNEEYLQELKEKAGFAFPYLNDFNDEKNTIN